MQFMQEYRHSMLTLGIPLEIDCVLSEFHNDIYMNHVKKPRDEDLWIQTSCSLAERGFPSSERSSNSWKTWNDGTYRGTGSNSTTDASRIEEGNGKCIQLYVALNEIEIKRIQPREWIDINSTLSKVHKIRHWKYQITSLYSCDNYVIITI